MQYPFSRFTDGDGFCWAPRQGIPSWWMKGAVAWSIEQPHLCENHDLDREVWCCPEDCSAVGRSGSYDVPIDDCIRSVKPLRWNQCRARARTPNGDRPPILGRTGTLTIIDEPLETEGQMKVRAILNAIDAIWRAP